MSQDKELEIRLQFLDEAAEYLHVLDESLLGISSNSIQVESINAALRAAHSIKGGAAMMGYQTLSYLAHRMEDCFKVLKVQRQTITIDPELEGLLLTGVSCLHQVIEFNQRPIGRGQEPDSGLDQDWLAGQVQPVFDRLHDRLGDPQPEDANSLLSPEDGQDIIPMLFQTEVEGCLTRLESVIASGSSQLFEEVDILAQELGGLGEMLELSAFTQLCRSIHHYLTAAPDRAADIAPLALAAWRRSQALVLTGQIQSLPTALEGVNPGWLGDLAGTLPWSEGAEALTEPLLPYEPEVSWETIHHNGASDRLSEPSFDADGKAVSPADHNRSPDRSSQGDSDSTPASEPSLPTTVVPDSAMVSEAGSARPTAQYRLADRGGDPSSKETTENSVRVPVRQLDQLNDLFGELTIERNGLDLHLKRLRGLVRLLNDRILTLEQSNTQLRTSYDRVSTQPAFPLSSPLLLPSGSALTSEMANTVTANGSTMSALPSRPTPTTSSEDSSLATHLRNRFDALEMDRYGDLHLLSQEVMETIVQIQEVSSDIELSLDDAEQTARELYKTSRQFRAKLTQVRMRPLSDILDRFPRAIRDLSLQYGKPVELRIFGANTLVDRNILEALGDPLMHLLRNAFDHGIEPPDIRQQRGKPEQGAIEIRASYRNNRTFITLHDDGNGIPLDKIRLKARQMGLDEMLLAAASDEELLSLIFEPGFSTSDQVTELSGRGVGMDVVRDRLRQIQGEVTVSTEVGRGTTFTISVPFTLSVTRALIVESNGMLLAFPIDAIEEMILVSPEQIVSMAGTEAFSWQDIMVQYIRLSKWLTFYCPRQLEGLETSAAISVPTVLLVSQGNDLVGIQVDRSWGEQEVTLRKVEGGLPMPPGFTNCTILGDGRVVPMVNITDLLRWITSCERDAQTEAESERRSPSLLPTWLHLRTAALPEQQPTVLVVDDSINVRRLLALTLEKAGYQVAQAKDGQDALDKLSAGLMVQAVICDIEMPRLDGYGFLAKVRSIPHAERVPVAMLTSRSGDKHRQLALSLGARAYFSKPYNEQVLLQTIEQLIEPIRV